MTTHLFPVAIEPGDDQHAFGAVVPDLPGCFSAGDTLEEVYANVREAIESHLEVLMDEGMEIPELRSLAEHQANPKYVGWRWIAIEVCDVPSLKKSIDAPSSKNL